MGKWFWVPGHMTLNESVWLHNEEMLLSWKSHVPGISVCRVSEATGP